MLKRVCKGNKDNGEACRQAPLQGSDFCFWHSPEHAEEAAEARRLGGLRRRKEKITSGAYDFDDLGSVAQVRRLLEVAVVDTLGLENSIPRSRTLAYLAQVALRTLQVGDLDQRIVALEQAVQGKREQHTSSAFDVDPDPPYTEEKEGT